MASGIHCDGPACTSWTKTDMADKSGFYTIFSGIYPLYTDFVAHFCSWECVMEYAAFKQPNEHMG